MSILPSAPAGQPLPPASPGALRAAANGELRLPTYDRGLLRASVVHLGLGGFHRSHQAAYFDDLAEIGNPDWGIVAASLRTRSAVDALRHQRGLYTLIERGSAGESARVVGSLVDCVFGPDDPSALVAALADERTRLVTLTITGDGYRPAAEAPERQDGSHPAKRTPWHYLVLALAERRRLGRPPFTVLSCDNLPQNGDAAREALLATAESYDQVLARWIGRSMAFPHSMVDRITPAPKPEEGDYVQRRFGVRDRCPVVAEPFSQWIVGENSAMNARRWRKSACSSSPT